MKRRKPSELIRFYYTWKKTERYDMFLRSNAEKAAANTLAIVNVSKDKINETLENKNSSRLVFFGNSQNF